MVDFNSRYQVIKAKQFAKCQPGKEGTQINPKGCVYNPKYELISNQSKCTKSYFKKQINVNIVNT